MWKNYFKTAYRTLVRNKNYTFLNMAGLGVGVAVFLVIFMIISFETSYDGFHTQKDRIFRVLTVTWAGVRGGISIALALSLPIGPHRHILLSACYFIVIFSIVVQGLTLNRLIRASLNTPEK